MTLGLRYCDICKMGKQGRVHRYGLSRYTRTDKVRPDGHRYYKADRSMGGIDLCDDCWEAVAKPNQRPKKSHPKEKA